MPQQNYMTKKEVKTEQTAQTEKSVEQVKMDGIIERLKSFIVDENIMLIPFIKYEKHGIFPDLEIKLKEAPVQNIYDKGTEKVS
jgi:hypothetical protein